MGKGVVVGCWRGACYSRGGDIMCEYSYGCWGAVPSLRASPLYTPMICSPLISRRPDGMRPSPSFSFPFLSYTPSRKQTAATRREYTDGPSPLFPRDARVYDSLGATFGRERKQKEKEQGIVTRQPRDCSSKGGRGEYDVFVFRLFSCRRSTG